MSFLSVEDTQARGSMMNIEPALEIWETDACITEKSQNA